MNSEGRDTVLLALVFTSGIAHALNCAGNSDSEIQCYHGPPGFRL